MRLFRAPYMVVVGVVMLEVITVGLSAVCRDHVAMASRD